MGIHVAAHWINNKRKHIDQDDNDEFSDCLRIALRSYVVQRKADWRNHADELERLVPAGDMLLFFVRKCLPGLEREIVYIEENY